MKYYSLVAALAATFTAVTALSIDTRSQQQTPLDGKQHLAQDLCLIELSPGETRWVAEEDKWELKRVRIATRTALSSAS